MMVRCPRALTLALLTMLALCHWPLLAVADVPVPTLSTHVNDPAGALSADQASTLRAKLDAFERRKGAQIVVLIVPTTQPETIEQFATRVFDAWKIGRKKLDDGVLLLWATNDRQIRIEVGYGLEGAIPDAIANRIINETLVPQFRSSAFYAGLDKATDQMIGLIDGEALPALPESGKNLQGNLMDRYFPLFFMLPIVLVITSFWPRRREISGAMTATAIATAAGLNWLGLQLDALPWAVSICVVFGLLSGFGLLPWGSGSTYGNPSYGGGRSSGGSSSGRSSGGWSGGGGRSGGGGASGSY
jgi:uncharacterized protein